MASRLHPGRLIACFFICLSLLWSCQQEVVEEAFKPKASHTDYVEGLNKMGLLPTGLGQEWIKAANRALDQPIDVSLPFSETFFLDRTGTGSMGYRFELRQGQQVEIEVVHETRDSTHLFMDVFGSREGNADFRAVASRSLDQAYITFEVRSDADYILRIQPELLRGGKFTLTIRHAPSLSFPVAGKTKSAILSFFGDSRDAGRRKHHGVDIFASRHTPIVAPTDGSVRFAGTRGLGGEVIWLHDRKRDQTLYFAHLQDIYVADGDLISKGDTLGTVGNSGNAKTTAPHLHFGIYQGGPQDPFHYIAEVKNRTRKIWGQPSHLGTWMRTKKQTSLLNPSSGKSIRLNRHQVVHLAAASSYSYRVELPDGRRGYIQHTDLEDLFKPVSRQDVLGPLELLERPVLASEDIKTIETGDKLSILGYHQDYLFVTDTSGTQGWVAAP